MNTSPWQLSDEDVALIADARHPDPFGVLGLHRAPPGMAPGMVLRAFVPGAETVSAIDDAGAPIARLERHGTTHVFEAFLPKRTARFSYRLHATRAVGPLDLPRPLCVRPGAGAARRTPAGRGHAQAAL